MATLVQASAPVHNDPTHFRLHQQRPQHHQHHQNSQHHQNPQHQQHHQQSHHHHHHHHHPHHHPHHPRQSTGPSYSAAVPIIYQPPGAVKVVQPNFYKQINIIPGLDAENAIVDTGVKLFRPSVNQTQAQSQASVNEYDGKRMRRSIQRRTVDYNASTIQMMKHRLYKRSILQKPVIQPDPLYYTDIVQPKVLLHNPVYSVTTRFVRASTNKIRCPVFTVAWTPEGRRVVTGTSSGEFTLWNGLTFNFETILQAHECAVRAMEWSHNDMWLLSGDHNGVIKYWQSNMNNVKMIQAHNDPIRGLSFCPTDNKFVTCSDDGLIKVWDFYRCTEERILRGHGADVKCVGWHPSKCMVASGSKDSQQPLKLWDPRMGGSLATIHSHKSTVMDIHWNKNGNWLLSGSRDRLIKVFDIRVMKEISTFRGHKKEAASVNWHPMYEGMFASGGSDGSIMFWLMGCDKELGCMENAHDGMIWDLKWHPLGHILCSGSNDHTTKFWTRNRPGDKMRDKYNLNVLPAGYEDDYEYEMPNSSQSEDDARLDDSMVNNEAETPGKGDANMEKYERPDLDSPVVKVLLEQASLEVAKSQRSEMPAQIFTVARNSHLLAPKFKIDVTIQREAIEEVERLEKKREKLLRQGIERTKRRKVALDESSAIAATAPSLLDMNIEVPDFLKGQEWEEGDEPFIEDAKIRAAEMAAGGDDMDLHQHWGPEEPDSGPPLDHGRGVGSGPGPGPGHGPDHGPLFDEGVPPNFNRPHNAPPHFEGSRYDGPPEGGRQNFEGKNFDGPRRPPFEGPRDGPPRDGPPFEGNHQFDGPRGRPNFESRRGNFPGPRGPLRNEWDNNRPPPPHQQHPNENYNGPRYIEPGGGLPRGPPRFAGPPGGPGRFSGPPPPRGVGPPPPEHFDHPPHHGGPRPDFPPHPSNPEFNDLQRGGGPGRWEDGGRRNERWQEDRR